MQAVHGKHGTKLELLKKRPGDTRLGIRHVHIWRSIASIDHYFLAKRNWLHETTEEPRDAILIPAYFKSTSIIQYTIKHYSVAILSFKHKLYAT